MSYQNSARWYREAEHVDMYKDDIYGMYEDGFFYDYEYDDDAPASEDEHEHSCNGSQASDEHEERHSDTNDEVAEEQSACANDSASTDIQHEHCHHTSALSEPESNANAVCVLATLRRLDTNTQILGELRVDRNGCGRRQSTTSKHDQKRHQYV
jgi:hypothetical protein